MNASNRYRFILVFCGIVCCCIWVLPRRVSAVNPAAAVDAERPVRGQSAVGKLPALENLQEMAKAEATPAEVRNESVPEKVAEVIPQKVGEVIPETPVAAEREPDPPELIWPLKKSPSERRSTVRLLPPPPVNAPETRLAEEKSAEAAEKTPAAELPPARSSGESYSNRSKYSPYEPRSAPELAPRTPAQEAVQFRAVQREQERRRRIEARRWIGFEPSRPPVSAVPFMSGTGWDLDSVVAPDPHTADRPTPSLGYLPSRWHP